MRLNPFKRRSRSRSRGSWLRPETKQAAFGVFLLALALVMLFSFFGQAGRLGDVLLSVFRKVFGWLAFPTPLVMAYLGYRLLRPKREPLPRWRVVGAILGSVGLLGLFHLVGVELDTALQVAYEGKGGGFLGFMLSYPLSLALSQIVAGVIFLAATIIGIFITFDLSPVEIVDWFKAVMPTGRGVENKEEEVEYDENEEGSVVKAPRFSIRKAGRAPLKDPAQLQLDSQENEKEQEEVRKKQLRAVNRRYTRPPFELLATSSQRAEGGDTEGNKKIIKETLEKFGIVVKMEGHKVGPTVTQYTLRPDDGVRLSQITALQNDLARALSAHPVRIEAPIPKTDLVGIEIPNKEVSLVRLRELLSSRAFKQAESSLSFVLGKNVSGSPVIAELDRMPHMLIAGATNSGKSVSIHSIIMALLYRNSPQLLRLVLIDPKRVELTAYNGIPHLWGEPVIVDTNKALNSLKWALREMDRRYKLLEESRSRDITSYNVNHAKEPLPYVVIMIDELADLMAKHAREVEGPVVRLSQLARAVGIHLVLATQRPSVNVLTGLIKANVPTRVAFKVASQVDSRTILDAGGAEKLVGTGDLLYMPNDNTGTRRLQGGYVSEEEVNNVVKFIVEHNPVEDFIPEDHEDITEASLKSSAGESEEPDDDLFEDAKQVALQSGKLSASLLQRRLRVGYARAARLLDMLEEAGVIGPAEGNKPREVLIEEERPVVSEADPGPNQSYQDPEEEDDDWSDYDDEEDLDDDQDQVEINR